MIFYKTSSFGNDFIEIDLRDLPAGARDRAGRKAAIPLGDSAGRKAAVPLGDKGALAEAVFYRVENKKFYFEIFNRDGSGAELSGNGMAGLAAVLFQRRLASSPLTLHGVVGKRRIELLGREGPLFRLNVEIGIPDFADRDFFPFLHGAADAARIDDLEFYPVSVGNPHAVVICRKMPAAAQLAALGKKLENHPMFPKRVNVEFVHLADAENCRVFFYERGVGPTLASSTGSAAVFAVLRRLGMAGDRLAIDLGAEKIAVSWDRGIFIHNFTRLVCRGNYFP
jgi:diaminopimelate epimerase